jgi:hypothetical protein
MIIKKKFIHNLLKIFHQMFPGRRNCDHLYIKNTVFHQQKYDEKNIFIKNIISKINHKTIYKNNLQKINYKKIICKKIICKNNL